MTCFVHTQHSPTLEAFVRSMEGSGYRLRSRRHLGLIWEMRFERPTK